MEGWVTEERVTQSNPFILEIISTLARMMEIRDASLFTHGLGTAELSLKLGRFLGLSIEEMDLLRYGGLLHDIGMLAMPEFISFKPGSLSADEWVLIRQHPEYGVSILSQLSFMTEALPIIENHHECWDGSGYPGGKSGEEIPFLARICTITSSFDAMTSDKVYRPGFSKADALAMMRADSGKVYDPVLLEAFTRMVAEGKDTDGGPEDLFGLNQMDSFGLF
jgi:putative nucleotidyltransferase with HDIG domain